MSRRPTFGALRYRLDPSATPPDPVARSAVLEIFGGDGWWEYDSEMGLKIRNHINYVLMNHLEHPWPPT